MALGQLFMTRIEDRTTTVHKPLVNEHNVLKQALGVDVDSVGESRVIYVFKRCSKWGAYPGIG